MGRRGQQARWGWTMLAAALLVCSLVLAYRFSPVFLVLALIATTGMYAAWLGLRRDEVLQALDGVVPSDPGHGPAGVDY